MTTADYYTPRVTVFRKPARGRFKVYHLWFSAQRRARRMAAADQPYHGFKTAAEAWAHADTLLPDFAWHLDRRIKGTPVPAGEVEVPRA